MSRTTRPRGYIASWNPQPQTLQLLDQVNAVLHQYSSYLPLTGRQVFYRLVATYAYNKTEQSYSRLMENLQKARRANMIRWEVIRDDKFTEEVPHCYAGERQFIDTTMAMAQQMRFDRQGGQERRLVLWSEARGIQPMLADMVGKYGIPVYSSGGFDSVTAKRDMALKLSEHPHEVIHLGDFDPSGEHVFSSLREDVQAFAMPHGGDIQFTRLAVTPDQIQRYRLPTAPPKKTDNRSFSGTGTVQLEAIAPDDLASIVDSAVLQRINFETYEAVLESERQARQRVTSELGRL